MPLQSSGNIALSQIASEFSDSSPHQLTEFYRNGSLVPSSKTVTGSAVTATSTSNTLLTHINRGSPYTTTPTFNSGNIYKHVLWHDNGGTGYCNSQFVIPTAGVYSYSFSQFIGNDYGVRGFFTLRVGSSTILSGIQRPSPLTGTSGSYSISGTTTVPAGHTVYIQTEWNSAGWAGNYAYFGGTSATSNATPSVTSNINQNVPTSGNINITNFYGAEDN